MYLLEETPEAKAMCQNVIRLLQSGDNANIELAFQLIEGGGMHEEISSFLQNKYEEDILYVFELETLHPLLFPFIMLISEGDYYAIESGALHDELSFCKNLRFFHLPFGSNVSHLPNWVGNWKYLKSFSMPYGHLVYLPESVGNWLSLNSISIFNNKLLCLPESVGNWRSLTQLTLSNNQLTHLPESTGNWKNLTKVYIANNQLTSLPVSAKNWVNLETIDISGNPIPNLPAKLQKRYEIQGDWQELLAQINGEQ